MLARRGHRASIETHFTPASMTSKSLVFRVQEVFQSDPRLGNVKDSKGPGLQISQRSAGLREAIAGFRWEEAAMRAGKSETNEFEERRDASGRLARPLRGRRASWQETREELESSLGEIEQRLAHARLRL